MDFTQWLVVEEISNAITTVYCEEIADNEEHAEIIARAKAGDSDAIEELWKYWQFAAAKKAASMLPYNDLEDDTVQDIVSDVTSKFFDRLSKGKIKADTPEAVGSFINNAVKNKVVDYWRHMAREMPHDPNILKDIESQQGSIRTGRAGDLGLPNPGRSRYKTPDVVAMNREEKKFLDDAISQLPTKRRAVIRMLQAGMDRDQIANAIGINKQTIKTHRMKGVEDLSQRMKALGLREESVKRILAPLMG
jgi:RNA polymerase sigma factor (sigma-70 family)